MKKIKFLNFILCFIVLLGCFCFLNLNKVSASTASFEEFEIGMTFPVGYELNISVNSNGVYPSKKYIFGFYTASDNKISVLGNLEIYAINTDNNKRFHLYFTGFDENYEFNTYQLGYYPDGSGAIEDVSYLKLISIYDDSGSGLIGINSEIVEPNYIYQGIYDLLGNLIYGSTDNLTTTQVGNLEFISQIIVIFCVLLPFIILLWVINRLFKF